LEQSLYSLDVLEGGHEASLHKKLARLNERPTSHLPPETPPGEYEQEQTITQQAQKNRNCNGQDPEHDVL
jgi:hypothetical protein